jgi:hypothetical protein
MMDPKTLRFLAVCDECGLPVDAHDHDVLAWEPTDGDLCRIYFLHSECRENFEAEAGDLPALPLDECWLG